jgi:nucleosome assembly protein 1-like 1
VRKARPTDSFFNFFSPPEPPTDEAIENGDIEEEELDELEEKLEEDYQIGEDLKEKVRLRSTPFSVFPAVLTDELQVIPRAVDYFTGKALQYEVMDDDVDDFDDDDEDEDDEGHFDEVRPPACLSMPSIDG